MNKARRHYGLSKEAGESIDRTMAEIERLKPKTVSKHKALLEILKARNAEIEKENIERNLAEKRAAKRRKVHLDQHFFIRGNSAKLVGFDQAMENELGSPTPASNVDP